MSLTQVQNVDIVKIQKNSTLRVVNVDVLTDFIKDKPKKYSIVFKQIVPKQVLCYRIHIITSLINII